MKKDLSKFRKEIDLIDKEIIDLISRRGKLAKQVGLIKDDGVIYRPEREAQILAALKKYNKGPPTVIININTTIEMIAIIYIYIYIYIPSMKS